MAEQRCPQCENQCPVSNLGCGRGRRYFGVESEGADGHEGRGEHRGHFDPEQEKGPIGLLRQCGHMLHHNGGGEELLGALTANEQATLESLLEKLLADWHRKMPEERHHRH